MPLTAARLLALLFVACIFFGAATPSALAETRSLKLHYLHTGEKAEIVFKRNGRYDQAGLKKLNRFLRDWRRNEPTKMDPRLFDLVWEVYRQTGSRNYINVVSAYRAPATNEMLRRTRGGQAEKSQHVLGRAMDFFIPGVKLAKLREIGMKLQGGGVGYYPRSGSPFVHLDVAGVRAWPRMSRQELVRLFPNGKTLHLPPDGKPLPGYQVALADYKKRKGSIPSAGGSSDGNDTKRSGGLLAALFRSGDDGDDGEAATPAPKPAATEVASLPGVNGGQEEAAPAAAPETRSLLPEQVPLPMARPRIESQVSEVALVAPPAELPAQAQIDAFTAAAAAVPANPAQAEIQKAGLAAIRDLSDIDVPLPQFLPDRATKPIADTEIASLVPPAESAPEAPAPADSMPIVAAGEALNAAAGKELKAFVPLPIRRPAPAIASAAALASAEPAAAAQAAPVELASLAPIPAKRSGRIASAFEQTAIVRKGPRPGVEEAALGRSSARRTTPKLTETIISQWALTRDGVKTTSDPESRGKRFVASQLRTAPAEVYAVGFTHDGRGQPHDRFTGSAVNFIEVARFGGDG